MIRYCLEYSTTKYGECIAEIIEDDAGDYVRLEDADYWKRLAIAGGKVIDSPLGTKEYYEAMSEYLTIKNEREGKK